MQAGRCATSGQTLAPRAAAQPRPAARPWQAVQQPCAPPATAAAACTPSSVRRRRRLQFGGPPFSSSLNGAQLSRRAATITAAAAEPATAPPAGEQPARCEQRGHRLEALVQLRKLYRNLLRAESLVMQASPVYAPSPEAPTAAAEDEDPAAAAAREAEERRRVEEAVEVVAEMELTAEQIKAGLRSLKACPYDYKLVFRPEQQAAAAEELDMRVASLYQELASRAEQEVALLPFASEAAAHAAIDARNLRYRVSIPWSPSGEGEGEGGSAPYSPGTISERLVKAEKAAEQFVARRLQPAVQRTAGLVKETSPESVAQGLKTSAVWAKDLWTRLNGSPGQAFAKEGPFGLPLPTSTEDARKAAVQALNSQLDALEKKLQDASKARESRLRKAGPQSRARMAFELRDMDNDIAGVSKALAVRTLQLEMEYCYGALEDEARDIVGDPKGGDLQLALSRRGSTEEVALLVAECVGLDEQLGVMASAVDAGDALFIDDGELAKLATDVPDLRVRLGLGDTEVFGGQGFSLAALQMKIKEGAVKIVDGVLFGVRGVKLLLADVGSAGKLFWRAVRGGTLKPREVQALRRTVRDVLTFVPFTIILIVPLTPVGHVLIFGFIQRYFPGFFPSQFTGRRQELMMKYDELKRQLREAELQAEAEGDEIAYRQKASAAMAALGRGAAAAVAAATGGAAAVALGAELEMAAAMGAAAAAAGAGLANAVGSGGSDADSVLEASVEEEEEEEGPAAKQLRQIGEMLSAAEDETYIAGEGGQPEEEAQAAQHGEQQQEQHAAPAQAKQPQAQQQKQAQQQQRGGQR